MEAIPVRSLAMKMTDDGVPERHSGSADLSASSGHAPPTPAQIFLSLAILLLISLGFGLAAQLLVR